MNNDIENFITFNQNKTNKILEIVKESFIEFYGEENRNKIEEIFKTVYILYYDKNIDKEELKKKILKETDLINNGKTPSQNYYLNIIKYNLHRNNNNNNYQFLFSNVSYLKNKIVNFESIIKRLEEQEKTSNYGFFLADVKNTIIGLRFTNGKMDINTLIHELSHALQRIILEEDEKNPNKVKYTCGISDNYNDLLNETINESITKEVLNIFKSKYIIEDSSIQYIEKSPYLEFDSIIDSFGEKIYQMMEKDIKKLFINGESLKIGEIIGKDILDEYNKTAIILKNDIKANGIKNKDEYIEKRKDFIKANSLDKYIKIVEERYNNYKEINKIESTTSHTK